MKLNMRLLALATCMTLYLSFTCKGTAYSAESNARIIIDHRTTNIKKIPRRWIEKAKNDLHIAYGHTSHGSQITSGMTGLQKFAGNLFSWNHGGQNGALDIRDGNLGHARDLGNPNRTAWAATTRAYLDSNPEINVVMWSWCGQASSASQADIETYLNLMTSLEKDYPNVRFIYMTGHTDGSGLSGNLHLRNQQIRSYCETNNKILYDFADIESYDPDGRYFGDKKVRDDCSYAGGNWAIEWQNAHKEGVEWYRCPSAHSQPLNANLKAYAAWLLWARLAGWDGR